MGFQGELNKTRTTMEMNEEPLVNELGTKWWLDDGLTEWCTRSDQNGVRLNGYKVWIVETSDGKKTRLLVDEQGHIVSDSPKMEDIAVKIDVIKVQRYYDSKED